MSKTQDTGGSYFDSHEFRELRNRINKILGFTLLTVIAFFMIMPYIWVVSTSLRTPAESFTVPPKWIPVDFDVSNYEMVFEEIPFWQQLGNSFFITFTVVIGQVITASLAGYAFARLTFPGRNIIFWIVLATLMIPGQATLIPVFILVTRVLGMGDTLAALIIPSLATAFGTFLLRQYFM
ncbi:MAG: carbohydrate ABC transporter permease, partial [Anaerolineae bacterium]|nr:carbohydrate ABC transporter permease [Anaerolineae bacterium]